MTRANRFTFLSFMFLAAASMAFADNQGKLTFPQTRAATDGEIKRHQALGRVVPAPDGSFFLYEWSRPYNWSPDVDWLSSTAAKRMQTWIYKVDTTMSDTTSYYLFHPGSGSTYYLGDLSPDGGRVAVYELDHDDNTIKLGVVTMDDPVTPTITWFEQPPVSSKLHLSPVWTANDELVYPTKAGLMRAKVPPKVPPEQIPINRIDWDKPVKAVRCEDCKADVLEINAAEKAKAQQALLATVPKAPGPKSDDGWAVEKPAEIPKEAKVLARAPTGDLAIYAVDDAKVLTLGFTKGPTGETLFENERNPKPYVPPKAAKTGASGDSK